jgi:aryl-alcohol dehydrogenase-like predicted oxidoreductase
MAKRVTPRANLSLRSAMNLVLFQVVQATWNLLEPSAGPALAEAKACGWGVIVKEALANGRLTDRYLIEQLRGLKRYAETQETTTDALAIAAALSQPWTDVVLSGAVTPEQLRSNVSAVRIAERMSSWPTIAEPAIEYWNHRSTLAWK